MRIECLDEIGRMVGMTMSSVSSDGAVILFEESGGRRFKMLHEEQCCESVDLIDICGDLSDLVGVPLLLAEAVDGDAPPIADGYVPESYTWTFVKFSTAKGDVTLRWYGSSNGYYGETPSLYECDEKRERLWW